MICIMLSMVRGASPWACRAPAPQTVRRRQQHPGPPWGILSAILASLATGVLSTDMGLHRRVTRAPDPAGDLG